MATKPIENLERMAKHIQMWLIDKLIPWARNPRTHSDAQVAQIAASIAEFGFNNPILVDTKAGIIAGHGRLLAARKLGLTEVPVIVLDHLTESQKRAYIIADNQLALNAGWDDDLLRAELAALQEEDFNLDLIGFDDRDLSKLLADQDAEGQADRIPDVPATPVRSRRSVAAGTPPGSVRRRHQRGSSRAPAGRAQAALDGHGPAL